LDNYQDSCIMLRDSEQPRFGSKHVAGWTTETNVFHCISPVKRLKMWFWSNILDIWQQKWSYWYSTVLSRALTMYSQGCSSRYTPHKVLSIANVKALICWFHILYTKRSVIQYLGPSNWHLPIISSPQNVGIGVTTNPTLELDTLPF